MEIINISSARWQAQLKNSIINFSQLTNYFSNNLLDRVNYKDISNDNNTLSCLKISNLQPNEIESVIAKYPMRITPYYLSLIKSVNDPIWKQAIPDPSELLNPLDNLSSNPITVDDPLNEEPQSPVPSIIHRYPDRVIFLVSNQCAMYCRHCMRKRKVGSQIDQKIKDQPNSLNREYDSYGLNFIKQGLDYIKKDRKIHDVIISGGDPLLLSTEKIDRILFEIRQIDHVETIRIHTRVLCTLPFRITDNLVSILEKYHPLYINTHFNHPSEITDEAASACSTLARAGIPLGCQTVLLKDVNDNSETMIELMRNLVKIRVKPYYLHHPDMVAGTAHFRPSFNTGLEIMRAMRGSLTGIAVPQYMIDLPGGYGKVPMLPDYIKHRDDKRVFVENYQGKICEYRF